MLIFLAGYAPKVLRGEFRKEQTSICPICHFGCKACLLSPSASSGLASPSGRWYNPNPWYVRLSCAIFTYIYIWLNSLCNCLFTSINSFSDFYEKWNSNLQFCSYFLLKYNLRTMHLIDNSCFVSRAWCETYW